LTYRIFTGCGRCRNLFNKTSQTKESDMSSEQDEHPFLTWVASLVARGEAAMQDKDVVLTAVAGKEFAVGVHDGSPLFCCQEEHEEALQSIKWSAAAILYNTNGRDWVVLSAKDVRVKGASSPTPVPVRLFLPIAAGRWDAWREIGPTTIHLGVMEMSKGAAEFTGTPFKSLPLQIKG
jgi:hypothetical protein